LETGQDGLVRAISERALLLGTVSAWLRQLPARVAEEGLGKRSRIAWIDLTFSAPERLRSLDGGRGDSCSVRRRCKPPPGAAPPCAQMAGQPPRLHPQSARPLCERGLPSLSPGLVATRVQVSDCGGELGHPLADRLRLKPQTGRMHRIHGCRAPAGAGVVSADQARIGTQYPSGRNHTGGIRLAPSRVQWSVENLPPLPFCPKTALSHFGRVFDTALCRCRSDTVARPSEFVAILRSIETLAFFCVPSAYQPVTAGSRLCAK
jgi:hypothetical protein